MGAPGLPVTVACNVTSPPSGGTEKAVAALEQEWLQGQKTNNPDLVAPLLADKIVVTEADGKVSDKAGTLAFYKNTKWDSAEYDDVKVTFFNRSLSLGRMGIAQNISGRFVSPEISIRTCQKLGHASYPQTKSQGESVIRHRSFGT